MAKNIKVIYDTCNNLIKTINSQVERGEEVDKKLLEVLASSYKDILDLERLYLVRCQDRFFGTLLMEMDFGIDFSQKGPVDLKITTNPYILSVNPLWCSKYNFSEFTGLIVEELTRLVFLHPSIFASMNSTRDEETHELLNNASDASASEVVRRDIRLDGTDSCCRLPKDAYTISSIQQDCQVNPKTLQSLEYYFEVLKKFKKKDKNDKNDGNSSNDNNMPSNGNDNSVSTPDSSGGNPIHNWEGTDSEETEDTIKSMVESAYNNLSNDQRGFMASSIVSQIKALLAPPEINWKQVLSKMVGSIPVPYRKTRTRLNRRQPYRSDLCGKLPKRVVDVVCCFDTSGSMSDDDIAYCLNEVFNIIKVYEGYKLTIVECDAEVQRVYEAKNMSQLKTKMSGRGGTSFIPAIEYINGDSKYKDKQKYPNSGNFKNALMVYFTDGYGDIEIPKPKTYRNLWVVLHSVDCLSLKNPYGDVKSLSMDKDYRKLKGLN